MIMRTLHSHLFFILQLAKKKSVFLSILPQSITVITINCHFISIGYHVPGQPYKLNIHKVYNNRIYCIILLDGNTYIDSIAHKYNTKMELYYA